MINDQIRAMVLAAGVGSRLKPLSDQIPKPLIRIGGRTIMDHIMLLLKRHGITNIISNTHYLADQIQSHFADAKDRLGVDIQFVYEDQLSGVAGGIRRCQDFLRQSTACIIMGDALTDIDLSLVYEQHKQAVKEHGCLATIAQMQVEDTTQFGVIVTDSLLNPDSETPSRVVKFQEKPQAEDALSNWANTGVYFFEPEIYDYIPSVEEAAIYDVAGDLFPKLLAQGKFIQAVAVPQDSYWADLGTPAQYIESLADLASAKVNLDLGESISSQALISDQAVLEGNNEIGAGVKVGAGAKVKNSIIWDNVDIPEQAVVEDSIIGPDYVFNGNKNITNKVLAKSLS
ncbi:MAG: NDP-sugar synthase [Candidatus Melainabacteria bacterium]|nr:NDP-sugar synthase [Candidatus Melainabacteria bacterium]